MPAISMSDRQGADLPETKRYGLWSDLRFAGHLIRRFWTSRDWLWAWGAGGALAVLVGGAIYSAVLLNKANLTFYDALTRHDANDFLIQAFFLAGALGLMTAVSIFKEFFAQLLEIRWRKNLVERYLDRWLADERFHRLELTGAIENPDQRIQEDATLAVRASIKLVMGFSINVGMALSFTALLWKQSESWPLTVAGYHLVIPAPFLWVGIVYALGGTWITHLSGRALTRATVAQQRYDADFRHQLIRVRDQSEAIALYRGGPAERLQLASKFDNIRGNWRGIMVFTLRLNLVTGLYSQAIGVLPSFLSVGRYFAGRMTLGALIQISNSFGQFVLSLSWISNSYKEIAEWRSYLERLHRLEDVLALPPPRGAILEDAGNGLDVRRVQIRRPDGKLLADIEDLRIDRGDRVLVRGASGLGKSTLLRTLAGIWPWSHGSISFPAGARKLFLPQLPYLPAGPLAVALAYPGSVDDLDHERMIAALRDAQLGELVARLGEDMDWGRILSPGEQQRFAIARALLQRPDFLFLDEATSALDPSLESLAYSVLIDQLPNAAIISIAHRESVARHHDRLIEFGGPDASLHIEAMPTVTTT